MKKFLLILSVLALCTQGIDAKVVTVEQAMVAAKQFATSSKSFNASGATNMHLNYVGRNMKGMNDYYVFNRDGGQGFVIVAGDDLSTPILGYSDKGSFDMQKAPEALQLMLKDYQMYLDWLRDNSKSAPKLTYDLQPYGVYPICGEVHWHQFPPYNNNCPASPHALTSNGRCYAGCVPVAFSTIMKGLRHPSRGFGEFGYNYMLDGKEMTAFAKFNDYSYNYSQMRNGYGENAYNAQAVSELVYEVGVAFHTIYSGESSDALLRNVIRGMIAFFDYNANIQYVQKSSYEYNDSVWYDMMYNEINNGRPVYYMGYRTIDNSGNACNIGHAFVLDGYDSNGKVHINWGFQPEEYNTYFDWELLSPRSDYDYDPYKSGFNTNQAAIIGICPDTTGIGGVVVKNVNMVADTMPANDLRLSIDVQSLSGIWNGTLKYGVVSKNTDGTYSPVFTKTASNVEIEDNGIVNLDLTGDYSGYYLTQGKTYYAVVYTPYFNYATETNWMWFLDDPVPFTIGDWATPPTPEVTEKPIITVVDDPEAQTVTVTATGNGTVILYNDDVEVARGEGVAEYVIPYTDDPEGEEMAFSATAQEDGKEVSEYALVTVEVPGKPEVTEKPVITVVDDPEAQTVTVTATGNGTVILYNDDVEVARGEGVAEYVIPYTDDPEGEEMGFSATAQEEGKEVSEYALATVEVPGKPAVTEKPVITVVDDPEAQTVTVTATGNGTVILYNDDIEVARGEGVAEYVIPYTDDPEGEEMGFSATAQEEGKEVSEYALATVEVPGKPAPQFILGDVDKDGSVTISDVTALIDYLLTGDATPINLDAADVDEDGQITIADVTTLIDMLLQM